MTERIVMDGPEDRCFGCGQSNSAGLRLVFDVTGPGTVETRYTAAEALAGASGIVHGGIQAVLLDEIMGMAVHAGDDEDEVYVVTAELALRYRRPVPTNTELLVRGRVKERDGRDVHTEGEIVDPKGEILTTARSRWRQIDR